MSLLRLFRAMEAERDHAQVFERFRTVLASLLASQRGRPAPRIVNPLEWMDR